METNKASEYIQQIPIHPFDIVADEIEARGLTKKEFAESIGMKPSNFSRMMKTKGELTSDMALKLESALGIPYSHWMRYQEAYLKDMARLRVSDVKDKKEMEILQSPVMIQHPDLYSKVIMALRPIREKLDGIQAMLSVCDEGSDGKISNERLNSIETDIHSLGKALCELRLS